MSRFLLFFLILLCLWFFLSVVVLVSNGAEILTEIFQWKSLSEEKKKRVLYDNNAQVADVIIEKTNHKGSILLLSESGKTYFLLRYFLYPQKIFLARDHNSCGQAQKERIQYIFSYHDSSLPAKIPCLSKKAKVLTTVPFVNTDNSSEPLGTLYKIQ